MYKPSRLLVVASGTMLFLALTASGASAGAYTETNTFHKQTDTFHDEVPCVGLGDITIVFNAVEHITENANGQHFTFTNTGTFAATLDGGGTSSGRFTMWGGGNLNLNGESNQTFTFSGTVKSGEEAGTSWNFVSHLTGEFDPDTGEPIGDPKVAFEKFSCH